MNDAACRKRFFSRQNFFKRKTFANECLELLLRNSSSLVQEMRKERDEKKSFGEKFCFFFLPSSRRPFVLLPPNNLAVFLPADNNKKGNEEKTEAKFVLSDFICLVVSSCRRQPFVSIGHS